MNHAEDPGEKTAGRYFPQLYLRRQEEPGPIQGGNHRLHRAFRGADGGRTGRLVYPSVPGYVREHGPGGYVLAVFHDHDAAGGVFRHIRQRFQYLFHPLHGQG